MEEIFKNVKTIAVVGVSDNPNKYGHKVFFDLLNAGFQVYPVHPAGGEIAGIKRYKNLSEIENKIDLVNIVVPPQIAMQIVKEAYDLGIKKIWLQPGAENQDIIDFCEKNNINCLHSACIMVEKYKFNK